MSNTAAELQAEINEYKATIDALLQQVLDPNNQKNIVDLHKEVAAHQKRINLLMERWKEATNSGR